MSTYSKFYLMPGRGEQITTVVTTEPEEHSSIFGRVVDQKGAPISGALVLLFYSPEGMSTNLVARFVTDEDGHFMFGPLESGALYQIKVFKNNMKVRELEIKAD